MILQTIRKLSLAAAAVVVAVSTADDDADNVTFCIFFTYFQMFIFRVRVLSRCTLLNYFFSSCIIYIAFHTKEEDIHLRFVLQ